MNNHVNVLIDQKSGCASVMLSVRLEDYLDLVEIPYNEGGGIEGQRKALSTKSAKRIRDTMVEDFIKGAVLPPVVLGVVRPDTVASITDDPEFDIQEAVFRKREGEISIIDGMQRTTAFKEALKKVDDESRGEILGRVIRVELWVSDGVGALIYRMLVLNTGQVPWNLRRQVEVVFGSLKAELDRRVEGLYLIDVDNSKYRKRPGEFQADRILEVFMNFASRSDKVNAKEKVAEEYSRLDIIESYSSSDLVEYFSDFLSLVVRMDVALDRMESMGEEAGRFKEGKDFFGSMPVFSSLSTLMSQKVLGRPGSEVEVSRIERNKKKYYSLFEGYVVNLESMSSVDLRKFMDFQTLNEVVSDQKGGRIGDVERSYFRDAFKVLFEEGFDVESMTVCWRA